MAKTVYISYRFELCLHVHNIVTRCVSEGGIMCDFSLAYASGYHLRLRCL